MWAIMVMTDELANEPESQRSALVNSVLPTLQNEIALWKGAASNNGPQVMTGAVGIAAGLPSGRNMFIYRDNLSEELQRRAAYSPEAFEASLRRIQLAFQKQRN